MQRTLVSIPKREGDGCYRAIEVVALRIMPTLQLLSSLGCGFPIPTARRISRLRARSFSQSMPADIGLRTVEDSGVPPDKSSRARRRSCLTAGDPSFEITSASCFGPDQRDSEFVGRGRNSSAGMVVLRYLAPDPASY